MDGTSTPSRDRSFLNLTTSTLFGIYQPTGYNVEREEVSTPWDTGAQTPIDSPVGLSRASTFDATSPYNGPNSLRMRRRSIVPQIHVHHKPRRGFKGYFLPLVGRVAALFGVGVSYGLLITHLHDRQEIVPVKIEGIDHDSWAYLATWGVAGVLLGQALPWADMLWAPSEDDAVEDVDGDQDREQRRGLGGWDDVVRSVGAFVGIAFAIRKLPWESTLQLSLTLALANPAVWYLIDRSPPGFILSTAVALSGTAILLGINPALVPSPSPARTLRNHVARSGGGNGSSNAFGSGELVLGVFSQESIGVATWIASVLFVSSVCFGNIGRRLAPKKS